MPRKPSAPAIHDPAAIRDRLNALVRASGRTQAELGAVAGMSQAQVQQVLSGHKATPSVRTVGRLLAALGEPWSALDP